VSGFTSAAAIVELPRGARPYLYSQPTPPLRPDAADGHDLDGEPPALSLTLLDTYAVNNPAYIPPRPFQARAFADGLYFQAGLPDFSWYNIPKREKITKLPQSIPIVH
jgi:hypothetical protein